MCGGGVVGTRYPALIAGLTGVMSRYSDMADKVAALMNCRSSGNLVIFLIWAGWK